MCWVKHVEALHSVNEMMYYFVKAVFGGVKSGVVKCGSNMSQWENSNQTFWHLTSMLTEIKWVSHDQALLLLEIKISHEAQCQWELRDKWAQKLRERSGEHWITTIFKWRSMVFSCVSSLMLILNLCPPESNILCFHIHLIYWCYPSSVNICGCLHVCLWPRSSHINVFCSKTESVVRAH